MNQSLRFVSMVGDVRAARRLVLWFGRDSGCVVSFGDAVGLFPFFVGWGTFRTRIRVSSFDLTWETRPSPFLCTPKERGERKAPERPCPSGQTSSAHPGTGHRRHLPSWQSLLGRPPCRPTPCRGARSRQGLTGPERQNRTYPKRMGCALDYRNVGWGKHSAPQRGRCRSCWGSSHSPQPTENLCFDVGLPPDRLPRGRAPERGWLTGSQPSSPSPGWRMAAGPVQGHVREVARQGQAIRGARFFCIFLCAVKERCSGASLRLSEASHRESRPKPTTTLCRTQSSQRCYFVNVGWGKRRTPQRLQRRSYWGSLRSPQPMEAVTLVQAYVREVLRPGQPPPATHCGRQSKARPRLRAGWQIGGIPA